MNEKLEDMAERMDSILMCWKEVHKQSLERMRKRQYLKRLYIEFSTTEARHEFSY